MVRPLTTDNTRVMSPAEARADDRGRLSSTWENSPLAVVLLDPDGLAVDGRKR
jgi:hypothetical protein